MESRLAEFGSIQVWLAPTEYGGDFSGETDEAKFSVKVIVGTTEEDDAEEKIDNLFNIVPETLERDRTLGGVVSDLVVKACTGHRLYAPGPDVPPVLGCEWTVKIVAND